MSAPTKYSDLGTKVRIERGEIDTVDGGDGLIRARVKSQRVIDELFNRKLVHSIQKQAADMFYADWYHGVETLYGSTTSRYDVSPSHGDKSGIRERDYTDYQMQCRERYKNALKGLEQEGQDIAHWVCCHNLTLTHFEEEHHLPRKYGRKRLCSALDMIAIFYGLINY